METLYICRQYLNCILLLNPKYDSPDVLLIVNELVNKGLVPGYGSLVLLSLGLNPLLALPHVLLGFLRCRPLLLLQAGPQDGAGSSLRLQLQLEGHHLLGQLRHGLGQQLAQARQVGLGLARLVMELCKSMS